MEEMVAIIAIVAVFGSFAAVFIMPSYFTHRSQKEMQKTVRSAIAEGQNLPAELIDVLTRDVRKGLPSRSRDIRRGVLCVAGAIGLALLGQFTTLSFGFGEGQRISNGLLGVACLPLMFGIAYLVLARFNKDRD
ncbi:MULTISPECIES: DUF6249 domain-containing protein [unclassified Brevundimonas]|uniref:DUF6249 domain-containing protein n=1 Tax=unclassified Brevundimonas TaxID=2622653 RepID=UPI0025BA55EF|nr:MULTISPECIES: DUF6249 domain-containing protein [unclassified Brevundimonas]